MKPLLFTYALLCGADAATTHVGLHMGMQEVWLPSQNPLVLDGVVAAQIVGATYGLHRLQQTHPRIARVVAWSIIGVRAAVVAHNLHELVR